MRKKGVLVDSLICIAQLLARWKKKREKMFAFDQVYDVKVTVQSSRNGLDTVHVPTKTRSFFSKKHSCGFIFQNWSMFPSSKYETSTLYQIHCSKHCNIQIWCLYVSD